MSERQRKNADMRNPYPSGRIPASSAAARKWAGFEEWLINNYGMHGYASYMRSA